MASFDPFDSSNSTNAAAIPAADLSFSNREWTEHVDQSSGKTYYSNSQTGETSWERPASFPQQQPEQSSMQVQPTVDFFADSSETSVEPQPVNSDPEVCILFIYSFIQ